MNKKTQKKLILSLFFLAVLYLCYAMARISSSLAPDFSVLYFATKDLLHHVNPYTNKNLYTFFAYPPVTTLLYIPLSLFPYTTGQFIFLLLSVGSIFGLVYTCVRIICGKNAVNYILIFSAFYIFAFPTKFTLGMGQSNLIALLLLLVGYRYKDYREGLCVALTAVAIILKPILVLILLFYLLSKRWRIVLSILAVGSIALMLSVVLYGGGVHGYYIWHVVPDLMTTAGRDVYYNQGILGFISRLTSDTTVRRSITLGVTLSIFISYIYIRRRNISDDGMLALITTGLVLIDTLSWQHHFVFLLFPFIYYYITFDDSDENTALSVLFYLTYLLFALNIRNPGLVTGSLAPLILSHQFLAGVLLYSLLYIKLLNGTAEKKRE